MYLNISKNGKYVEIDIDQHIFENKSTKEQIKLAHDYIINKFGNGIENKNEIYKITNKSAKEYTHPHKKIVSTKYRDKLKASTELDNLLKVSKYIGHAEEKKGRQGFAKNGFDYYKTYFKLGNKLYEGIINIAIDGNDNKLFYDITKIKDVSDRSILDTTLVPNVLKNSITQESNYSQPSVSKNSVYSEKWNKNLENLNKIVKNKKETYTKDISKKEIISNVENAKNKIALKNEELNKRIKQEEKTNTFEERDYKNVSDKKLDLVSNIYPELQDYINIFNFNIRCI